MQPSGFLGVTLLAATLGCTQHHEFSSVGATDAGKGATDAGIACDEETPDAYPRPLDVLFVIDNSESMRQEQEALRAQLPRLVHALATGDVDADGTAEYPPVADAHLGVISTDLGLGRYEAPGCTQQPSPVRYGDNGTLLTRGAVQECGAWDQPERFVAWGRESGKSVDASRARKLSCLVSLGTDGCSVEQPLESMLKALWPSDNKVNGRDVVLNPPFHGIAPGRGAPSGINWRFLRNEPGRESVVLVVVLTDEDDCSWHDPSRFAPEHELSDDDPLKHVGSNLRCFGAPQNLHSVSRYVEGLRALRPGRADLVQFVAVVGVPLDLVDRTVDLAHATDIDAYYGRVLADSRMQEVPDPTDASSNPSLTPSCVRPTLNRGPGDPEDQRAYPPRRIVQVARGFRRHGAIESICQDDFTEVIDRVVDRAFITLQRTSCAK